MKAEINKIWQTAINLGFQFNETDAHEMWYEIKRVQMRQKKRDVEEYYKNNPCEECDFKDIGNNRDQCTECEMIRHNK